MEITCDYFLLRPFVTMRKRRVCSFRVTQVKRSKGPVYWPIPKVFRKGFSRAGRRLHLTGSEYREAHRRGNFELASFISDKPTKIGCTVMGVDPGKLFTARKLLIICRSEAQTQVPVTLPNLKKNIFGNSAVGGKCHQRTPSVTRKNFCQWRVIGRR